MHDTLRALGGVPRQLFGTGPTGRSEHLFGLRPRGRKHPPHVRPPRTRRTG